MPRLLPVRLGGSQFQSVASGLSSFEQMRKSHAISYARIERRKLQGEARQFRRTLGFRDGQWVESQFRFPCGLIVHLPNVMIVEGSEKNKEGKERR